MQKKVGHHAAILQNLQNSICESGDMNITTGRHLSIEKWVKTYIRKVEHLKDDKLQFLYNIFHDENCWSGTRLNNSTLGQKLTEEKMEEVNNPFCMYNMACKYCVVDRILPLFYKEFESHKGSISPSAKGNPVDDKYIRNDLLDSMAHYDPVFSFWIDKESEELQLRKYSDIDGFRKAVKLKWLEGTEYFYNRLSEREKKEELINTIVALSSVQCNHNRATVLDFCLYKMDDSTKHDLLPKLSEKDQGVYSLLNGLIEQGFLNTAQDLVKCWFYEEVSVPADKMLSHRGYSLLFSSPSGIILENPGLSTQATMIMMDFWRCDRFSEHKKASIFSNGRVPIKRALAGLVVGLERNSTVEQKSVILEVLQFAKESCSFEDFESFKSYMINNLKIVGRAGMKKGFDYSELIGELFSELEQEVSLPSTEGNFSVSGDPQSTLRNAGVSGFSCHRK